MVAAVRRGQSLRAVAQQYHVGVATVALWVKRAKGQRLDRVDWLDRSSAPHTPHRTTASVEDRVMQARRDLAQGDLGAVGADVLAQYCDSPTVSQTAEAAGKWAVGSNSDLSQFAPKAYLTGHVWHWTGLFAKILTEIRNGTWKPGTQWGNLADGTVLLGPLNKAIPADVVSMVEKTKDEIVKGQVRIFTGPIKDNTGKEQLAEGTSRAESELTGQTWLVDNIEGTIPR